MRRQLAVDYFRPDASPVAPGCIKLLPAAILVFGVFSAYADSETDRYMAAAGTSADQLSGPMSFVSPSYNSSLVQSSGRQPRICNYGKRCRSDSACTVEGGSPRNRCPCLMDFANPNAMGTCK